MKRLTRTSLAMMAVAGMIACAPSQKELNAYKTQMENGVNRALATCYQVPEKDCTRCVGQKTVDVLVTANTAHDLETERSELYRSWIDDSTVRDVCHTEKIATPAAALADRAVTNYTKAKKTENFGKIFAKIMVGTILLAAAFFTYLITRPRAIRMPKEAEEDSRPEEKD